MIINKNDKMLISHRRLYKEDASRFFTGIVEEYQDGLVRISGYSWQMSMIQSDVVKKEDMRTKIISLSSGMFICYQLPVTVEMESLHINYHKQGYSITDGKKFVMDLSDKMLKSVS
jgi:hypothetical protein